MDTWVDRRFSKKKVKALSDQKVDANIPEAGQGHRNLSPMNLRLLTTWRRAYTPIRKGTKCTTSENNKRDEVQDICNLHT